MPMLRKFCRIVGAACILTSAACSTTPIAQPFHLPPAACLTPCEHPARPPRANDQGARNAWEHDTLLRFGACVALHADCEAESMNRMQGK